MSAPSRSPWSPARFRRALAGALAAGGLAGALLLSTALPASAHDEIVSSDPAPGSTVSTAPAQITLTFNEKVLTDAGATAVEVTDNAGAPMQTGEPVVSGTTVTQTIALAENPDGVYTVVWKVVSSDGHPVSGDFSFTIAGAAVVTPPPTATPTPTPTETATAAPTPSPSATPAPGYAGPQPWVWIPIVVALVGGAVLYLLVSRSRRKAEDERLRASATGSEPPAER